MNTICLACPLQSTLKAVAPDKHLEPFPRCLFFMHYFWLCLRTFSCGCQDHLLVMLFSVMTSVQLIADCLNDDLTFCTGADPGGGGQSGCGLPIQFGYTQLPPLQ